MGWSYGGYMTSWVITQTKRFKAASVGAGVTNLMSFNGTADIPGFIPDYFGGEFWDVFDRARALGDVPRQGRDDADADPARRGDLRVPVSQGFELYNALKRQGVPVKMVVYPRSRTASRSRGCSRTRWSGTSNGSTAGYLGRADTNTAARESARLYPIARPVRRRCGRLVEIRPQVPLEERPRAIPGVTLFGRIFAFQGFRVHAPVERVAATGRTRRGIDIDLRFGKVRLERAQLVNDLLPRSLRPCRWSRRARAAAPSTSPPDNTANARCKIALLERQPEDAFLRREAALIARAFVGQAEHGWSPAPSLRRLERVLIA